MSDLSALSLLCTLPAAAPSDSHQPPRRSQLMQLSQNLGHMVGLAYVSVALIVFQTAAIACAAGSQCAGLFTHASSRRRGQDLTSRAALGRTELIFMPHTCVVSYQDSPLKS